MMGAENGESPPAVKSRSFRVKRHIAPALVKPGVPWFSPCILFLEFQATGMVPLGGYSVHFIPLLEHKSQLVAGNGWATNAS
jgi:hypothetical protein